MPSGAEHPTARRNRALTIEGDDLSARVDAGVGSAGAAHLGDLRVESAKRAEELAGLIIKACVDAGGSITGEHGVGIDKKA